MGKEGEAVSSFLALLGIADRTFAWELKTGGQNENTTAVGIAPPKVGGLFSSKVFSPMRKSRVHPWIRVCNHAPHATNIESGKIEKERSKAQSF
jgi:hypothetical protein